MLKLLKCGLKVSDVNVCCVRGFYCTVPLLSKGAVRQTWVKNTEKCLKKAEKILSGDGLKNKKRPGNTSHDTAGTSSPGLAAALVGSERLARHLGIVLSNTITSVICSGEFFPQLTELGFKIQKVSVESDMSGVSVTWAARGDSADEQIAALLPAFASQLRSSLMTEGKMWRMPPIQFIMDDTVRQMREVEELLAVADMGPDFEPTLLGNGLTSQPSLAGEQKTTNPSCRSDINVSEVPGPGDSVELVSDDHKQSFAEHSEIWNNIYENTRSLQTPEDMITEKLDKEKIDCDEAISVDNEMAAAHDTILNDSHHCRSKNAKAAGSQDANHTSDVRSDIYGLDHARLWQQVLLAKRKSVNRSYGLSDELIAHYSAAADSAKTDSTRDLLARSKLRKRHKKERLCRNPDYLLSCHYHNNVED